MLTAQELDATARVTGEKNVRLVIAISTADLT